jgi:hypothetical protein
MQRGSRMHLFYYDSRTNTQLYAGLCGIGFKLSVVLQDSQHRQWQLNVLTTLVKMIKIKLVVAIASNKTIVKNVWQAY